MQLFPRTLSSIWNVSYWTFTECQKVWQFVVYWSANNYYFYAKVAYRHFHLKKKTSPCHSWSTECIWSFYESIIPCDGARIKVFIIIYWLFFFPHSFNRIMRLIPNEHIFDLVLCFTFLSHLKDKFVHL